MFEHAVIYLAGLCSGAFLGVGSARVFTHRIFKASSRQIQGIMGLSHSNRPRPTEVFRESWVSVCALFFSDETIKDLAGKMEEEYQRRVREHEHSNKKQL